MIICDLSRTLSRALWVLADRGYELAVLSNGSPAMIKNCAGLVQLPGGASKQDHIAACAAEPERDRPADAAASPGDERGLAGEVSCHSGLLNG
jgi:hypothetical protein